MKELSPTISSEASVPKVFFFCNLSFENIEFHLPIVMRAKDFLNSIPLNETDRRVRFVYGAQLTTITES